MLRTKDLVLFVLAIAFLLIAIVFTVAPKQDTDGELSDVVMFNEVAIGDKEAVHELNELDRASIIARLRDSINNDESISSYTASEELEEELVDESELSAECQLTGDPIAFLRAWPREKVEVSVLEGARLVAEIIEVVEVNNSATTSTSSKEIEVITKETNPLLVLPLLPMPTDEPSCVTSEIVGITTSGGLLFNSDASAYMNESSNSLIGYARDGYPVYGPYSGAVDECGGYITAAGYRYAINSIDKKVLGCYKASPQNFVGE